jgi:membrane fusion protein, multidrug efflux system
MIGTDSRINRDPGFCLIEQIYRLAFSASGDVASAEMIMKIRGIGILSLTLALGAIAGWYVVRNPDVARAADAPPHQPDVPVMTAVAQSRDVPVYLGGLGTVQAFNTVEIKAQVSGYLVSVPVREGQEVKKGDIVAEIDPRPYQAALDQATAQRDGDQATLQSARLDLQRYRSLAKSSYAPVQQVDDQQGSVSKLTATIAADTAAIETARLNLEYTVMRAPFDGRVSLRQTDIGNLIVVATQTGIISITQDKPISVVFTLPEAELTRVQDARAKGTLPVDVVSSDGTTQLATGTLLTPNNTIDTTTGTITLKAVFDNKDDRLWPGEFVNARVQVDTLHNAVTIPELAVQHGPGGLFVYVVKPDHTVAQENIAIGYQDNGMAVVTKGLSANDVVAVSGQSRLAPGVHVSPTDASKAPGSSADQAAGGNG